AYLEDLAWAVAAPVLPATPRRRDPAIAPLIAGNSSSQAWLDWVTAMADLSQHAAASGQPGT
ncbi:MAG: hypothetical protein JWO67_6454, partial [Streptosporangiaceae bacterium]|nr:hypothetical protein [Streptosporangiaceae bacterium]